MTFSFAASTTIPVLYTVQYDVDELSEDGKLPDGSDNDDSIIAEIQGVQTEIAQSKDFPVDDLGSGISVNETETISINEKEIEEGKILLW